MANLNLIHENVGQLLHEAGCTDEFTRQFLTVMQTEDVKKLLCLLRGQRRCQLRLLCGGQRMKRLHKKRCCCPSLRFWRLLLPQLKIGKHRVVEKAGHKRWMMLQFSHE